MGRRGRNDTVLMTAAALGAVAGLRSMSAPALLSHEMAEEDDRPANSIERLLSSDVTARVLALMAGGEMLADKTAMVGNRTSPIPLIGRALMGSLTAAAFAANRRNAILLPAAVGAVAAVAATYAAYHIRRIASERLDIPDRLVGLVEDAIVVGASRGIAGMMDVGRR